jgi:hypothetical protein
MIQDSVSKSAILFLGCMVTFLIIGCGSGSTIVKHDPVFQALGEVILEGAPLEGATVIFNSPLVDGKGWVASGVTDYQGKFEITTRFGPGQVEKGTLAGDYTVVVMKAAPAATAGPVTPQQGHLAMVEKMKEAGNKKNKPGPAEKADLAVPAKYTDPQKSPLRAKVGAGEPNFKFSLGSK